MAMFAKDIFGRIKFARQKQAKRKRVKSQFVLTVGEDGAVLIQILDGKMVNRLFVNSVFSPDVEYFRKLFVSYPRLPIYLVVDVMEQSYVQNVLPPVSAMGVKKQIQRRLNRDFRPDDLKNAVMMSRSKEGRRDWNVLFISLANSPPFSGWLEFVAEMPNKLGGIYLLPVEAESFASDISKTTAFTSEEQLDWHFVVLHNKVGGFRLVVFQKGKIVFTRLAQSMGETVADVIVGGLEQEILNTMEYLRRLAFNLEGTNRLTIVSSAEILQRVEVKNLKFSTVTLLTPYQAAQKLGIENGSSPEDRFADVMFSMYFASKTRHKLKFSSKYTQELEKYNLAIQAAFAALTIGTVSTIGYSGYESYNIFNMFGKIEEAKLKQKNTSSDLEKVKQEFEKTQPQDAHKMIDTMLLHEKLAEKKDHFMVMINRFSANIIQEIKVNDISWTETGNAVPLAKTGEGQAQAQEEKPGFKLSMIAEYKFPNTDEEEARDKVKEFLRVMKNSFSEYSVSQAVRGDNAASTSTRITPATGKIGEVGTVTFLSDIKIDSEKTGGKQ